MMTMIRIILISTCFYSLQYLLHTSTDAFQVTTKSPSSIRRPLTSILAKHHPKMLSSPNNDSILPNSDNNNNNIDDDDVTVAESNTRRQLLFSLLASTVTTSTTAMIGLKPLVAQAKNALVQEEQVVVATAATATASSTSVANAFQNALGGKLIIPPLDTRSYDIFTMSNGLKVILCSDASSNTASAAMNVHVGAASDPDSVPGLAHFNEHMLFLGTRKYPETNSFENFLSANGGSSNAFTDSENTVYYFDMAADDDAKLRQGLDRFGSFFSCPLFTESSTLKELNAIESEHAKNLQSDIFRLYQIEKSRANSQHPYSKFYTGNKATLLENTKRNKIDLRTELIKFWSTYYSADQMAIAVVAPQPIALLKDMVVTALEDVPVNGDRLGMKPEEDWVEKIPPFFPGGLGGSVIPARNSWVQVVPVADIRQLILTWPIVYESVQDKECQFLNKPAYYVSHLLGHEGPASLLSYLKKQGWANGVGASTDADFSDFYTLQLSVQLTQKGLEHVEDVVEAIFSCIRMLREDPWPRYILDEVLQISELEWRFLTPGSPGQYSQSLSQNMLRYPQSLVIAGPRRLALRVSENEWIDFNKPRVGFTSEAQFQDNLKSTLDFVSKLTVDNCLFTVVSKSFDGKTNKVEKWYGTKYGVKPLGVGVRNQWLNCRPAHDFGIYFPQPNKFIPDERGLVVKKPVKAMDKINAALTLEERLKPTTPPSLIRNDERWTVYFKQDDKFGEPKAYAVFELLTKDAFSSPRKAALASLYQVSANDRLQEYAYDASLTGLTYDINVLPRGVRLTFGGYNDKLLDFAAYVSKKLSQEVTTLLPDSQEEFERYRDELRRAYAAFDVQQPYSHAIYYTNLLLQPKSFQYTNAEMRVALENVTLEDLTDYVVKIWDSGKVEALLQGNIDEKEALQFVDVIDRTLRFDTMSSNDLPPHLEALQVPLIGPESNPVKISSAEPNSSNKNAAVQVTFQCLDPSEKAHVVVEVLSSIIAEKFYEDLRTKQQLGYIVSCGVKAVSSSRLLSFVVQSSVAPVERLNAEIFKFLNNAKNAFLDPLSDAEIQAVARALVLKKTDPDKKLASEATRNWNEIATGRLQFDRRQKEAQTLLKITKKDVLEYWDEIVLGIKGGRRMLVSEVIPNSGDASSRTPAKSYKADNKLGIDDVDRYRMDREQKLVTTS